MKIIDCEQQTEEWFRARFGMPTASEFSTILAKGKDGGASVTRRTYMNKLAGEIITGEPMENYTNAHMERGRTMEEEARNLYAFLADEPLQRVGFIVADGPRGHKGCSPDCLVGSVGMLEIKTALPHILIAHLLKNEFPPEHKAQCQGALWIAEREWIDIAIYWPRMPLFVKRAHRDEEYIVKLSIAVDQFNVELQETVRLIRDFEGTKAAA